MSNLLEQFRNYVNEQEIDLEKIHEEAGEDFTLVTFAEEGEQDIIYNVILVFYNNNDDVEVYIRKAIEGYDELSVLKRLNELNGEYSRATFLIDDDMLTVKSHCFADGDLMPALRDMVTNMQIAKTEFAKF